MKNTSAMKKAIQYTILVAFLVISSVTCLKAQNPPHPGQTSGGGAVTGDRIGDAPGAPVGSGTIILTLLAAAYGGKKVYNLRKEEKE